MMTNVIIGIISLMALSAAFLIGYFMGMINAFEMVEQIDDDAVDYENEYCFECESKMPTFGINGQAHCANCGTSHSN